MTVPILCSQVLVEMDKTCDYLPISPVTNLVALFLKYVILPHLDRQTVENSHYYRHLKRKDDVRCVILLIPILGNILITLYDFSKREYTDPDTLLSAIKAAAPDTPNNIDYLKQADPELLDDEGFIGEVMKEIDINAFQFASDRLQQHPELLETTFIAIVSKDGMKLRDYSEKSKENPRIVTAAFKQNRDSLQEAKALRKDKDFVISLLDETVDLPLLIQFQRQLQKIHEDCLETLRTSGFGPTSSLNQRVKQEENNVFHEMVYGMHPLGQLLRNIDSSLRTSTFYREIIERFVGAVPSYIPVKENRDCVMAALSQRKSSLAQAPAFHDDREMARYAFRCDPQNAQYFSQRLKEDRDFILELAAHDGMVLFFAALKEWQGKDGEEKPVLLPGFRDDDALALVAVRQNHKVAHWLTPRLQNDIRIRQILDDVCRANIGLPPRDLRVCGAPELPLGSSEQWFVDLRNFLTNQPNTGKWLKALGDMESDQPKNPNTLLEEKIGRETLWKLLHNTPQKKWLPLLERSWNICNQSIELQIKKAHNCDAGASCG